MLKCPKRKEKKRKCAYWLQFFFSFLDIMFQTLKPITADEESLEEAVQKCKVHWLL